MLLVAKDAVLRSLWSEVTGFEPPKTHVRLGGLVRESSQKLAPRVLELLLQFAETLGKSTLESLDILVE